MAQRGQSYQQILAHYFPSTRIDPSAIAPQSRVTSHFRLVHPQTLDNRDAEYVVNLLESTRTDLLRRVSAAGLQPRFPDLEIVINETTGDFVGRTGMPPWAAAATKRNTIDLQPLKLLKQRRILETTLRHELVHVLIDAVGGGQTPRWLAEGMAVYVAGEGRTIDNQPRINTMSLPTIEQTLASAKSSTDMRNAYAAAYNLVKQMIRSEGETKVWQRVAEPQKVTQS
jgi:hypothetical protein